MASVYRFQDCAAVHTTGGPTRYIDAPTARKMAAALYRVARSIDREQFSESTCGTWAGADHERPPAPAPAYTVRVESYSLEPGRVGEIIGTVYESRHKSPRAASRRLAELINAETPRGRELMRNFPYPAGGRYTADGLSLNTFRKRHGL